jgi:hypothetical protein
MALEIQIGNCLRKGQSKMPVGFYMCVGEACKARNRKVRNKCGYV